jgi:hypothetical protein
VLHVRRDTATLATRVLVAGAMIGMSAMGGSSGRAESGPASGAPASSPTSGPMLPAASAAADTGFVTSPPPDPAAAWTGIDWRLLEADDPFAQVRTVDRWRGGFIALGAPVQTDDGWRTPSWVSVDGASWRPLPADVFGSSTIIIGIGETPSGLVALTLQSGADQCAGEAESFSCWTLAGPLESWTSPDATSWTAHPGPSALALPEEGCDDCGVTAPILAGGTDGLLMAAPSEGSAETGTQMARSTDGVGWQAVPAGTIPADISLGDVVAAGSGFLATGEQAVTVNGEDTTQAVALTSADGLTWDVQHLPTAGLQPRDGSSGHRIVSATDGVIVEGSDDLVPGTELWWSSTGSGDWTRLEGYPPLGVWQGEGEGSGLMPDGTIVGDGGRMLAYRAGPKPAGWTSSDGRSWTDIKVTGTGPASEGEKLLDELILTPLGVMATGEDGSTWFGTPLT